MRFFTYLAAAAALPLSVFAIPAAPLDATVVEKREPGILPKREPLPLLNIPNPAKRMTAEKIMLAVRQENNSTPGLGDLLGGLLPALRAVGSLLNAETIEKIKTIVDGAAVILGNGRAESTGNLLDSVGGLLSSDLLDKLSSLLPSISGLLSQENIELIQSLLQAAGIILTPDTARQLAGLFNDIAPVSNNRRRKYFQRLMQSTAHLCYFADHHYPHPGYSWWLNDSYMREVLREGECRSCGGEGLNEPLGITVISTTWRNSESGVGNSWHMVTLGFVREANETYSTNQCLIFSHHELSLLS